jgi:hypothetical protein
MASKTVSLESLDHDTKKSPYEKVRFRVSGEPFDIAWTELEEWKTTTLYSGATFAISCGRFVSEEGKKIPHVVLNEDPHHFRILRHFMRTRELVLPTNQVDRQLLMNAADFYGFGEVCRMIALGSRESCKSEKKDNEPAPLVVEGFCKPSAAALAKLGFRANPQGSLPPDISEQLRPFWRAGHLDALNDEDAAIRAQELRARVAFGREEDGTELLKPSTVTVFEKACTLETKEKKAFGKIEGKGDDRTEYSRMVYPRHEVLPGDVSIVDDFGTFETQFQATSGGLLDGILGKLPLVVAGGSVLACLHRFPRVLKPEGKKFLKFLKRVSSAVEKMDAEKLATAGISPVAGAKLGPLDSGSEEKKKPKVAPVEKDEKLMRIANTRLYCRYKWQTDSDFRDLWRASLDEQGYDEKRKEVSCYIWDHLMSVEQKADMRFEFMKWKEQRDEGGLDDASTAVKTIKGPNLDGFSYRNIEALAQSAARGDEAEKNGIKISFSHSDLGRLNAFMFIRSKELNYDGDLNSTTKTENFDDDHYEVPHGSVNSSKENKGISAEERKSACIRMYESFRETDIDLFLITRDPNAALEAIVELHAHLLKILPGPIEIVRTAQSVTFYHAKIKIQVINRLYWSVEHVLLGFDLDCCCFAYDGQRVVASPRGQQALKYRTNIVDPSRQSLSYESRLLKYAVRGFSISVPGLDIVKQMRATLLQLAEWKSTGTYLGLKGAQLLLGMLHSVAGDQTVRRLFRFKVSDYGVVDTLARDGPVLACDIRTQVIVKDRSKVTFVRGHNLEDVLFSNKSQVVTSRGGEHSIIADVPETITFQMRAPHAQDRVDIVFGGAFFPTDYDWYKGTTTEKLAV